MALLMCRHRAKRTTHPNSNTHHSGSIRSVHAVLENREEFLVLYDVKVYKEKLLSGLEMMFSALSDTS